MTQKVHADVWEKEDGLIEEDQTVQIFMGELPDTGRRHEKSSSFLYIGL